MLSVRALIVIQRTCSAWVLPVLSRRGVSSERMVCLHVVKLNPFGGIDNRLRPFLALVRERFSVFFFTEQHFPCLEFGPCSSVSFTSRVRNWVQHKVIKNCEKYLLFGFSARFGRAEKLLLLSHCQSLLLKLNGYHMVSGAFPFLSAVNGDTGTTTFAANRSHGSTLQGQRCITFI